MSSNQGPSKQPKHIRGFNISTTTSESIAAARQRLTPSQLNFKSPQNGPLLTRRRYARCNPHSTPRNPTNDPPELINIHSAFHAGAYQQVLDFDTSSFSPANSLPVRVLKLRSQIALGQAKTVSAELASEKTPDLLAVKLLADSEQGKDVLSQANKLAEQHGQENLTVQICVGIVLERAGETEAALELLSKHQGSLDA